MSYKVSDINLTVKEILNSR